MDTLNDVKKFHKTFAHPILSTPQIPKEKRCILRVSLIAEELKEFEEAIRNNNIVEAADALCDLQYVLSGAILEFGLADKFPDLFAEVQRSNMSKACETLEQAEATIAHYTKQGSPCYSVYDDKQEVYIIYRTSDDKLLKSIDYSPANLKPIIES